MIARYFAINEKNRSRFFALALLSLGVFLFASKLITDPDFWWHLKTGELIYHNWSIPHTDLFSFTASAKEWITHEWLSELIIYIVFRSTEYPGLIALFAVVTIATFAVSFYTVDRQIDTPWISALVVAVCALATIPVWGARPQIFGMLLTSISIAVISIALERPESRALYLMVPVTALWANLHASFALGIALLALAVAGLVFEKLLRRPDVDGNPVLRKFSIVLAASILVVPLNPSGLKLLRYPFDTLNSAAMQAHIEEWFSPNFHEGRFLPLLLLIIVAIVISAVSSFKPRPVSLMLAAFGLAAVLRSARHLPLFALTLAPFIAPQLKDLCKRVGKDQSSLEPGPHGNNKLNLLVAVMLAIVCIIGFRQVVTKQAEAIQQRYPERASAFLKANPSLDRIFNSYEWGGYLIWANGPDTRVFIDGRADLYGDAFLEQYMNTAAGREGWRKEFSRYEVNTALLRPDSGLYVVLKADPDWTEAYKDDLSAVFVRNTDLRK